MAEIKIDASRATQSVKELNKQLDSVHKNVKTMNGSSIDLSKTLGNVEKNAVSLTRGMQSADKMMGQFGGSGQQTKRVLDSIEDTMPALRSSLGGLTEGIAGLAGGLTVGLGAALGAVKLAWDRANESAEYYFSSVEGSIAKSGIDGYRDTLRSLAIEHRNLEQSAETVGELGRRWRDAWQYVKNYTTAVLSAKSPAEQQMAGWQAAKFTKSDKKIAEDVAKLYEERQAAIIRQKENEVEIQNILAETEDMRAEARKKSTADDRKKELLLKIEQNINKVYEMRRDPLAAIVQTTQEINSKTKTTTEEYFKQLDLEMKLNALDRERAQNFNSLVRLQNSTEDSGRKAIPMVRDTRPQREKQSQLASVNSDKTAASVYNWGGKGIFDAKAATKDIKGMADAMSTLVEAEYSVSDAAQQMTLSFSDWLTVNQDSVASVLSGIESVSNAFLMNLDSDSKSYKTLATVQIIASTLAGAMSVFAAPDNITMAQKIASYMGVIATGVGSIASLNTNKLTTTASVPQLSTGLPTSMTAINTANTANAVEDSQVYITEKQLNDNAKKQAKIKEQTTF